jgi:hypothetical protein
MTASPPPKQVKQGINVGLTSYAAKLVTGPGKEGGVSVAVRGCGGAPQTIAAGGTAPVILKKREIHRLERAAVEIDALGVILTYVCQDR